MKISNLVTIAATGKADNSFIGLKIQNNKIEFHYPETFRLSNEDAQLRNDILAVLRTVSLAKTRTKDMSSYNTQFQGENVFPLGAFLWIINDYLIYGRYENREKTYLRGNGGRINWKRTMRSNPIISNGKIIYSEIVSEKKSQKDNILTEIYFYCVQRAIDAIGWLYGISFDPNGIDYYQLFNQKKYLSVINTELMHTFDDNNKNRLSNMRDIITGLDENTISTREIVYGVDKYDYVYERMVDSMFSRVDNIKDFYPNAYWNLVIEDDRIDSSNLRPDTVLIKNNKVYILDAKYYRYGTTFKPGDMPETTSVQKQITYGEYVKAMKEGKYDDVYSAFVLPYSKNDNKHSDLFHEDMVYVGTAYAPWINHEEGNNRKIIAIMVDTNYLISSWARRNEDNMNGIINLIEHHIDDSLK